MGSCKRHRQGRGCRRRREHGATVPVTNPAGHARLRTLSAEELHQRGHLRCGDSRSEPGRCTEAQQDQGVGTQECAEKPQAELGTVSSGFQQDQGQAATFTETNHLHGDTDQRPRAAAPGGFSHSEQKRLSKAQVAVSIVRPRFQLWRWAGTKPQAA